MLTPAFLQDAITSLVAASKDTGGARDGGEQERLNRGGDPLCLWIRRVRCRRRTGCIHVSETVPQTRRQALLQQSRS